MPSISPDDDVFRHLSLTYSQNHGSMYRGEACSASQPGFKNGITNGAEWYPLTGGMQDFNYVWNGCMEITIELSCCKYPSAKNLHHYWKENQVVSDNTNQGEEIIEKTHGKVYFEKYNYECMLKVIVVIISKLIRSKMN